MRVSRRSRLKFSDFANDFGTVRTIRDVFAAEDFLEPPDFELPPTGVRRALVAAIHSTISDSDPGQQLRLVRVYLHGIDDWARSFGDFESRPSLSPGALGLIRSLRQDGFDITDDGEARIPPAPPAPTVIALDRYDRLGDPTVLQTHLDRIGNNLARDPPAAIGSSKELVESTCKFVLDDYGVRYERTDSLLDLFKGTATVLEISRESVRDNVKGSKAAKRALQNLSSLVQSVAEMRNELGLGHGQTRNSAALERHARLTFNAARTVVEFVLDTWHFHRDRKAREAA